MDFIALAQAGPVAILLVFIGAMVAAFVKGLAVPGWLYRQEREQRIAAELREAKLITALGKLTRVAANGNGKPRNAT